MLRGSSRANDAAVVRRAGGDDVFGVDDRADRVLIDALSSNCGVRWPGVLVMEGYDERLAIGDARGPWVYLVDPIDGTRPWLAGKRSAWVLLGAGRSATGLEDLEVGAAVEVPTTRSRLMRVAWATNLGPPPTVYDEDVDGGTRSFVTLTPRSGADLHRAFVTVARFAPGTKGVIGHWEDDVLSGLEVYEDPWLCSGGQMLGVASGSDAAVLDPRPLFGGQLCAHPYDLAAIVVARAAGVVVEALPPGPLDVELRPDASVAWAAYANVDVAAELRRRMASAG